MLLIHEFDYNLLLEMKLAFSKLKGRRWSLFPIKEALRTKN